MTRIADLALVTAPGATAASAEEIKPGTSKQAMTTPTPIPNIFASFGPINNLRAHHGFGVYANQRQLGHL